MRLAALVAATAFLAGILVYRQIARAGDGLPLPWRDESAELGPVELARPVGRLFRTRADLARFLRAAMPGSTPTLPAIDFRRREAILAATGPRSSTGYTLRVVRVVERRSRIEVELREDAPTLATGVVPRLSYPYRLITIPRSPKPVFLDLAGRP